MRTGKKILAFLLAVVMICSMIPAAAATEEFPRTRTWSDDLFADVSSEDWYYENVKNAYELGLMSGYVDGRFNPTGKISIAQTIAVAARIHAIATMGEENVPWIFNA